MVSDSTKSKFLRYFIGLSPHFANQIEQSELIEMSGFLCSTKDFDSLRSIAQKIESPVGRLYEVLSENNYDNPAAFHISYLPDWHLAKSFVCIAQALRSKLEFDPAFKLCLEATRLAQRWDDVITNYQAQKEMAIIQSLRGDHKWALSFLQNAYPLIVAISKKRPALYYDYSNSLAVELNELGRVDEACVCADFALASPYASAYAGWHETHDDIMRRGYRSSRSVVMFSKSLDSQRVLLFQSRPVLKPALSAVCPLVTSSPVINLAERKTMMANTKAIEEENKKNPPENIQKMGRQQKQKEIMNAILDQKTTDDELRDILKFITEKKSQRKDCQ
jgi:hypothetical protein